MKIARTVLVLGTALLALAAFSTPSVAGPRSAARRAKVRHRIIRQLGLSPAQKAQIRTIRRNARPPIRAIRKDTSLTRKEKLAALKPLRQARRSQVVSVLTPAQRAKLQRRIDARRARRSQRLMK